MRSTRTSGDWHFRSYESSSRFSCKREWEKLESRGTTIDKLSQRWVLVYSEGLYHREAASLQRVIDKERAEAEKMLRRLNRREYPTPEAAQAAVETMAETWKLHRAD